jgi:hypothetical protein
MNLNLEMLKVLPRFFDALNALIADYGVYFYLVFVCLALAVIAWIFSGGLRRRMKGNAATVIPVVVIIAQSPKQPEPPLVDIEVVQTWSDDDESAD